MNAARGVRIEANLKQEGFVALVGAQVESLEAGLHFLALHDALGRPTWEDFVSLSAKRFVLEAELYDEREVAQFRGGVEAALSMLGADWRIMEFGAQNTESAVRAGENVNSWD